MRSCGKCTLCCRLLPVKEIGKLANTACRFQCSAGCTIYQARPASCRVWSCAWLTDPDEDARFLRPDLAHYVIDTVPSHIEIGEDRMHVPAIQVWVDPAFPDAHRDPALREFLAAFGEQGLVAIIRYNGSDGFALIPPGMNDARQWIEAESTVDPGMSN